MMKRLALLTLVLAAIPAPAQAVVHLGDTAFWTDFADGMAAQAVTWLGDLSPVAMTIVGAGLVLLVISAIAGMIPKK